MRLTPLVATLVLWPLAAVAADLMVRQRVTSSGPKSGRQEEIQYWTATKRVTDSAGSRLVIDLDARTMTMADKARKTYHAVTFAEIRQQTDQLRAQLEKLPPEAKKMMPDLDAEVMVKATGKTDTVAGHDVKEYAITSGLATGTVWITEDFTVPGDTKAWQDAMSAMSGPNGPGGKLAVAMAKLNGVPLRSTFASTVGQQKFTTTTEVLEIATTSPPAEVLAMPTGFTKADARGSK